MKDCVYIMYRQVYLSCRRAVCVCVVRVCVVCVRSIPSVPGDPVVLAV